MAKIDPSRFHANISNGKIISYVGPGYEITPEEYQQALNHSSGSDHTPMMPWKSEQIHNQIQLDQDHFRSSVKSWNPPPTPLYGNNCPDAVRQNLLQSDSDHSNDVRRARNAFQSRSFWTSESQWVANYNRELLSQGKRPIYLDEIK